MAELSKKTYDEQTEEVLSIVNAKHDALKRLDEAGNKGVNAKMKKILDRLMGIPETPKKVIYFYNDNNEKLHIRTSDGNFVGTIILNNGIKSKIELVDNRPIFVLYKNGEQLYKKDVLTGQAKASVPSPNELKSVFREHKNSLEMIEATKQIFMLIENKQYQDIDAFILHNMEILVGTGLETAPMEQKKVYSNVKFIYQKIRILVEEIKEYAEKNIPYDDLLSKVDNEYRSACQILINAGLYELPNMEDKVTRS